MMSPVHWLLTSQPIEQAQTANVLDVILLLMSWIPLLVILCLLQYSWPLLVLLRNV